MKRGIKITLIVLGSAILALGCFVGGLASYGTCFDKYQESSEHYNDWMKDIKDDAKLIDIAMPGSHDSGTINMPWVANTQSYSIKEQLMAGVRYLDIRVNKKSEDNYVIFHDVVDGTDFWPILTDIKEFILANPTETLLLDFQHFKGGAENDVRAFIKSYLYDDNLLVEHQRSSSLTDLAYISDLNIGQTRGKCIAMFPLGLVSSSDTYIFPRNNDACSEKGTVLNSCYIPSYNKMKSSDYICNGLPAYFANIRKKIKDEHYKGFFVLQGQLTDGKLIFGPWSREKSHASNMEAYIDSLKYSAELSFVNVIMRDFVNPEKAKKIINLNRSKENIKETEQESFFFKFGS